MLVIKRGNQGVTAWFARICSLSMCVYNTNDRSLTMSQLPTPNTQQMSCMKVLHESLGGIIKILNIGTRGYQQQLPCPLKLLCHATTLFCLLQVMWVGVVSVE